MWVLLAHPSASGPLRCLFQKITVLLDFAHVEGLGLGDRAWLTHTAQYHQELLLRKPECVLRVFQYAQQTSTGAVFHH